MADDPTPSALSPDQEDIRTGKLRNWEDAYERALYIRAGKKKDQLTALQEMFVNEYQIDFNATQAYLRAGGPSKYPQQAASQMLKVPKVAAAIEELRIKRLTSLRRQQEQIILELANMTHVDMTQDLEIDEDGKVSVAKGANPLATRAVKKIKHKISTLTIGDRYSTEHSVDVEIHDKNTSARTLLQHLGALPEHVRIGGPNGESLPMAAVLIIREVDETTGGEKR